MAKISQYTDGGTVQDGDMFVSARAGNNYKNLWSTIKSTLLAALSTFSAYRSTNQSVNNATFTKVQFDTEEFDTDSYYDNATNYRFQPTVAGKYLINTCVTFATGANQVVALIYKNGSRFKDGNTMNNTGIGVSSTASAVIDMNGTTDYAEIFGWQNSGGPLNITGSQSGTFFQGTRVR